MENSLRGNGPSTSGMSNTAEGTLDRASSNAHAAIGSIAGAAQRKAKPAIDRVASIAHHAVDKAVGAVAPTANWLSQKGESLTSTRKKFATNTSSYITANPLKAAATALVVGVLLGRIFR